MQNDELKKQCEQLIQEWHATSGSPIPDNRVIVARALLQRLKAEEAGYVLVPKEPTDKMIAAAFSSGFEGDRHHLICDYEAMLSAVPKPD